MRFPKSIVFLLLLSSFVQAQNAPSVEKNQFKINVLLPGFVYEYGINNKNTLYSELSAGYGYSSNSYLGDNWNLYPYIQEQFRHYYNLEKRTAKGKLTSRNSGNFIAMAAYYNFKTITTNEAYSSSNSSVVIAPVWGFQRTYKHKFNLDLNVGAGYGFSKNDSEFVPILNFTLGWVIGK